MQIGEAGLTLIRRFEGFAAMPYRCPAGWMTVGYGHVMRRGEALELPLTLQAAERLLRRDVWVAEALVNRLILIDLTQNQFDALCSFTYNVGGAALERSTLRRVVNREAHDEIPRQFLRWVYASGRVLPGLVRRREAEISLYIS